MEETNNLDRIDGFFGGHAGGLKTSGFPEARARDYAKALTDEVRTLRAQVAKLEARATAGQPDLAGNAQMKERSRCMRIVARAIADAHAHPGLSNDTRDGVRMAAEVIIEAIESGKEPQDASADGAA